MFSRAPKFYGNVSEPLGLWEFQAESEATEMIHRRRAEKVEADQPEQEKLIPNFGRQVNWGRK